MYPYVSMCVCRTNANGPLEVAEFQTLLDDLRSQNSSLVAPVLALLVGVAAYTYKITFIPLQKFSDTYCVFDS